MKKKYSRILFVKNDQNRIGTVHILAAAFVAFMMISITGCGGHEPKSETLDLDGEREFERNMIVGDSLLLDVRNPGSGGYDFAGCRFDPDILRLDRHWLEEPEEALLGNFGRAFFQFTALAPGSSELVIKIQRPWENATMVEEYKRLRITVEPAPAEESDQESEERRPDIPDLPETSGQSPEFEGEASSAESSMDAVSSDDAVKTGPVEEYAGGDYSGFEDAEPMPLVPEMIDENKKDSTAVGVGGKGGNPDESAPVEPSAEKDSGWFDWMPFVGDDESESTGERQGADDPSTGEISSAGTKDVPVAGNPESDSKVVRKNNASDSAEVLSATPEPGSKSDQIEKKSSDDEKNGEQAGSDDSGGWFDWLPW